MRRNYTLFGTLFLIATMFINTSEVGAQVKEIILYDSVDTYIDEGSPSTNRGQSWNLQTNYSGGAGISRFGLTTWDLQWLADSIPAGESVLYAEMLFNLTNTTPPKSQGLNVIFLNNDNFDGYVEGIGWEWKVDEDGKRIDGETEDPGSGLTWGNMSNQFIFLHPLDSVAYHDTLFSQDTVPGKGGGPRTFEVTSLVQANMAKSDKIITMLLTGFNPESEEFLGWYSQEADWPDPRTDNPFTADTSDDIVELAPRILVYYGTQEFIFIESDPDTFGTKQNYITYPKNPAYYWVVDTIEGSGSSNKVIKVVSDAEEVDVRTATGNLDVDGLGAQLLWGRQSYSTFDVSFKAQLAKADPIIEGIDGQDLALIFDWIDKDNYSCFLFNTYLGGFVKIEDGKRVLTEGDFGFVNSNDDPKFDAMHLYEIVKDDASITVSIDGTEFASTTEDVFVSGEGKIGIGSLNNQVFFDDFKENTKNPFSGIKTTLAQNNSVKLFPNPVNNIVNIRSEHNISQIKIYNVVGAKVMETGLINSRTKELNVSNLESGVYVIQVSNTVNSEIAVSKLLKVD